MYECMRGGSEGKMLTEPNSKEASFVRDKTLTYAHNTPGESQCREPDLWVEAFQAVMMSTNALDCTEAGTHT